MKILFFSPYFHPYTSGVTTYPLKVLTHLAKNNDVTVLTFLYEHELSNQVTHNKLTIIRMPFLFKISKGFISPQSIFYFLNKINKSDLVILNQPNFEGLFLAIIAKILNKKIISIFHCQVFLSKNIINNIISFFLNLSMKIQLKLSNKIVTYTEDYFDSFDELKQFRNKTISTLPPIDKLKSDNNYLSKLKKIKKNNIWIGYSGRIASEKGLEYLIEAIHNIVIPAPDETRGQAPAGIRIVFAGPYGKDVADENNYYQKIKELLARDKIKHSFFGNLTSKQLGSFYKMIDVLVLSSVNQTEAFGMVQAEAMIAGTPVIASNLPGVRMPIKLTKMGIIVESKNTKQIKQAILEILSNRNKFSNNELIKNAKNIFDIKKVYKFYENLINNEI